MTPWRWASPTAPARVATTRAASAAGRGTPAEPARQVAPLDELQGEVGRAGLLADLVDLDDVRVLQPGDGLGLAAEPLPTLGRQVRPGQDHLEGDGPVQFAVAGAVDHPHAAAADLLQNVVAVHAWLLAAPRPRLLGEAVEKSLGFGGRLAGRGVRPGGQQEGACRPRTVGGQAVQRLLAGGALLDVGHDGGRLGAAQFLAQQALELLTRRAHFHCGSPCEGSDTGSGMPGRLLMPIASRHAAVHLWPGRKSFSNLGAAANAWA